MTLLTDIQSSGGKKFEEVLEHCPDNGMLMEFGVATGISITRIASQFPHRTVYGFDWFEGLPEDWRDNYRKGAFKCNPPEGLGPNVELITGLFQDTLEGFLKEHPDPIAFLHMDADLYSSTAYVLNLVKDQLQNGTIIIFDEIYGYAGYQYNEYKAFEEFLALGLYKYDWVVKIGDEKAGFRLIKI